MSELVLVADHDHVRVLTLNRPESRNALNRTLIRTLYAALKAADADEAVRAVVLTGTDARVGILPGGGMTARLPQVVGSAMARRLSMTGEVVDAARAEHIGLVTEVVPHDRLLARAMELANRIAEVPRRTMLGLKQIYSRGAATVTQPALAAEGDIAGAHDYDLAGLDQRRRDVVAGNKAQIDPKAAP